MPEPQQLQIKISVSDTEALRKLNGLITRVGKLREAVDKIPTGSISTVTTNINTLTQALQTLASTGTGNLQKVGEAIKGLFKAVASSELSTDAKTAAGNIAKLTKLAEGVSGFSSGMGAAVSGGSALSFLNDAVKQFASLPEMDMEHATNALTNISKAVGKASESSGGLEKLASGLVKIPNAIKKFDIKTDYTDKIASIKTTLDGLAGASEKAKSVGTGIHGLALGLKTLPKALEKFGEASQYTDAIREVAKALYLLAPAVEQVSTVGSNIHNLATGIKTLPKALEGIGKAKDYEKNIEELRLLLLRIREVFSDNFGAGSSGAEAVKSIRSILSVIRSLSKIGSDKELRTNLRSLSLAVREFVASLSSISSEQSQKVYDLGVGLKSLVDASRNLEHAQENLEKVSKGRNKWADTLKNALKSLGSELKKLPKRVKTALKWLAKLAYMPIKPIVNGISKITHAFNRFFHSAARIALYRLIRSGLRMITQGAKEGIDNLYKWAQLVGNDFVPTMDHLASEFLYLKNSVGAAISPVIQALEPVITNIIRKFVELLNVFNQFVSMVSGKDKYRRAIYYATTYGDAIEDSMSGAGKAAKELQDILMDFDQLNLITTPKDRNTGKEADEDDYGLMFELVDVDENLFDWLQNADWTKFGYDLADRITNALKKIDWNRFKSRGVAMANKLASFLNGVFANENLFSGIGEAAALALNGVTSSINTFVYNTNWEKLGNDLASSLKKFLEQIDPVELGRSLGALPHMLSEIIIGFAENMTDEDWKKLRDTVYTTVASAINSINWEKLIPSLVEITTGLINAITAAIKGVATAKNKIMAGIKAADIDGLRRAVGDFLTALCTDIPIIPTILVASIAKVAVSAGATVAFSKLFASSLSSALGTVGGGASAGATGALSGAGGAGGAMAAMPYVAIAIACVVTAIISQIKWRDAQGRQFTSDSLATEFKKSNNPDFTFLSNMGNALASQGDIDAVTASLDTYLEKLQALYELAQKNPRQFGLESSEVGGWYSNLASDLQSGSGAAVTAAQRVDDLYNKYVKASDGIENKTSGLFGFISTGTETTGNKVVNKVDFTKQKAFAALDELLRRGEINLDEYKTLNKKVSTETGSLYDETLAHIRYLFNSCGGDYEKWGADISTGIANGIWSKAGLVHGAVVGLANDIKRNMAFSEPEEGPLSDFHTYMPDMLDLMAQGIRENAYKVENEVTSLAGRMSKIGSMAVDASVSASLNGQAQGMADEIYDANSEERALLRELINAVREKQLVVSPSASLGKVVTQSSRLYAGVTG